MTARPPLLAARRLVIKLGTRVVTHDDGSLALARLFEVIEAVAALKRDGRQVLLVSSGALGLGWSALGLDAAPSDLAERQACAAVGQSRLMQLYQEGFSQLGFSCGQVLLTQSDFDERSRYLNLRATLEALLARNVVPVINENDAVATEELAFLSGGPERPVFGDNDKLSALVAAKLGADLLILLTDVPGICTADPRTNPDAKVVARVSEPSELEDVVRGPSGAGRGGMRSKLEAAGIAARSGCHAVVCSGRTHGILPAVVAGEEVGSWVVARAGLSGRRRWIAFASAPRGTLHLDPGAVKALRERGASLLAAGVDRVDGAFSRGDVVELRGPSGATVGRGVVNCSSQAAKDWADGTPPAWARSHHALVHRDQLAIEGEDRI